MELQYFPIVSGLFHLELCPKFICMKAFVRIFLFLKTVCVCICICMYVNIYIYKYTCIDSLTYRDIDCYSALVTVCKYTLLYSYKMGYMRSHIFGKD